jgi:hypothetical protein
MNLDGKGAEHEHGQVEAEARQEVELLAGERGRTFAPEDTDRAFLARYLVVRGGPALDAARTMSAVGFSPADIARGFRDAFEVPEIWRPGPELDPGEEREP